MDYIALILNGYRLWSLVVVLIGAHGIILPNSIFSPFSPTTILLIGGLGLLVGNLNFIVLIMGFWAWLFDILVRLSP